MRVNCQNNTKIDFITQLQCCQDEIFRGSDISSDIPESDGAKEAIDLVDDLRQLIFRQPDALLYRINITE